MIAELENKLCIASDILDSTIDGIIIIDFEGKIQYVNHSFLRMFKYDNNSDVMDRYAHELFADVQIIIEKGNGDVEEFTVNHKDGTLFPVEVSSSTLTDNEGNVIGTIASFNDISYRKQLERQVEEKTDEVKNLSQKKDDFIWQLGHDLKTPLVPIITLLPIVEKKEQDPELKELLPVIISNFNIIKDRINKILDIAQLSAFGTEFDFRDVSLQEVVNIAINNKRTISQENNVVVCNEIDEKIRVNANKQKLVEVFDNLLSNSIKYSPNDSKITIFAIEENNMVTVSFEDTGIGMSKDEIIHVFDEFYKTDDSRHDLHSSGLGLSICKQIIEKHGGEIFAISLGEGKGVTFYFTLKTKINH